jgi:O-antigen ligase
MESRLPPREHSPRETEAGEPLRFWARLLFLLAAGLTGAAAPWLLGGHRLEAQWTLLVGAGLTLLTGLAVRLLCEPTTSGRRAWKVDRISLIVGLGLLGLMVVQALNPAYRVVLEGRDWRLAQITGPSWAPQSLLAPFDDLPGYSVPFRNAWRYLLIFGLVWVYGAGLAAGFRERRNARIWAVLMGVNGAVLALVCIVHRASGATQTLWNFSDPVWYQAAPVFFYKNHNGAYLAALTALVVGLAASAGRTRARWLWGAVAFVLWVATAAVGSRIATAFATAWGVVYFLWYWRSRGQYQPPGRLLAVVAVAAGLAVALLVVTGSGRRLERFGEAGASPADFLQGGSFRMLLRQVGITMWWDHPVTGWGGGSFLYLFGSYQQRIPAVAAHMYANQPTLNHLFIPYADSDWVEFLVEYGALGVGLMVAGLILRLRAWMRWRSWTNGLSLFLMLGSLGLVLHAYNDSILRNPALLMLFVGLQLCALRIAAPPDARVRTTRPDDLDDAPARR